MKSFEPGFIGGQAITQSLASTLLLIGEYKGRHDLLKASSPEKLEAMRHSAMIQSTISSNRIEGIEASQQRVANIVAGRTEPEGRSEQEIAGYRECLRIVHDSCRHMPFSPGVVRQLHRDLYAFTASPGGEWKDSDNKIIQIIQTGPDGDRGVVFEPVPAWKTGVCMDHLHERFNELWGTTEAEPILLIASYVLDFLCIHPFNDGNGRMSRLISLLLLYKAGHEIGRYVSLERIVEETRDSYYSALRKSSVGWHEGTHSLLPWWEYFTGVMLLTAYKELDGKVSSAGSDHAVKRQVVLDTIERMPAEFRYAEIREACPAVSRSTMTRVFKELRDAGKIQCVNPGRNATWRKISN